MHRRLSIPSNSWNYVCQIALSLISWSSKDLNALSKFITFGGGHTDSDAFLYLPAERIIFTGDLVVVKNYPGLSSSHHREWLDILAKIKSLDPVCLVPGHGQLGTFADVALIERYINELLQMVERNWHDGGIVESVTALQPPAFTEGSENATVSN